MIHAAGQQRPSMHKVQPNDHSGCWPRRCKRSCVHSGTERRERSWQVCPKTLAAKNDVLQLAHTAGSELTRGCSTSRYRTQAIFADAAQTRKQPALKDST